MDSRQLESYLERIGFSGEARPDLDTLKRIQEHHIYSVPVENLDILEAKLPLSLAVDDLFEKVVVRHRGGLSFELAVLLEDALTAIGYEARLIAARHPRYGHDFDHAAVMVDIPGEEGTWLVDVGFTECPRTILLFDGRFWQSDARDAFTFRIDADDDARWQLVRRRNGQEAVSYSFTLDAKEAQEYDEQCKWFCTNGKSRFTQGPFVFIERPEGRICLSMDTVLNTFTGEEIRPLISTEAERAAVLREIFGLEMQVGESNRSGYCRVFAAIDDDELKDAVIRKAVSIALDRRGHLRFGHIVSESKRKDSTDSFPEYVQIVRERMSSDIASELERQGVSGELFGGEVVVMGSNKSLGATIDAPANFVPEQLVESLIKPFVPDVVVCGCSGKSRLASFLKGSTSEHLRKKLDCEIVAVEA